MKLYRNKLRIKSKAREKPGKKKELKKKSLSLLFNHKKLSQKVKEKHINSITLQYPLIGFNSSIKIF
jgi:hypothetical protein